MFKKKWSKTSLDFSAPHTRFDGYGGFYYLLQENGFDIEEIPQNENRQAPSWFKKFKLFIEVMLRENQKKFSPVIWNNFNENEKSHGQDNGSLVGIFLMKMTLSN